MSARPAVDVVVPFYGPRHRLVEVLGRLDLLNLGPDDTLTVVDNRPAGAAGRVEDPRVLRAPQVQSAPFSRNAGAFHGSREWIVFIDADVVPASDVVEQYFAHGPPADDVAVLAGAIHDQEPPAGTPHPAAARYMFLRKVMSQHFTKAQLGPFAKTANAAFRRSAFEAVGGFQTNLFCGEDVDICYRLAEAGWRLEFREEPVVDHIGRESVPALLRQWAKHGTSVEWLDKEYPGFSPPFTWRSLVVSVIRGAVKGAWAELRGDHDRALIEVLDPLTALAFHLGRLRSNYVQTAAELALQEPEPIVDAEPLPVSVVIPVFNRAERLEQALASVAGQRRPPAQTIVVDDGSSDSSAGVAERGGAQVVRHETNQGQARARNSGVAAATQPWVAFLDSDDEWLPGHLEHLWELRHRAQFVASSSINCRPDPSRDRIAGPLTREPTLLREPWRLVHPLNFVTMSTVMTRRDALVELGGFRPYGQPAEDLDMWLRLLKLGPARVSPRVTVVYHVHGEQLTGDMPRLRGAHLSVAGVFDDQWPASLISRQQGAHKWDEMRDALEARKPSTALRTGMAILASPRRCHGVLELLAWRFRARRATARVRRDGGPSVALLVSSARRDELPGRLVWRERQDLRRRRGPLLYLRLARRPAGVAVTDSRLRSRVARILAMPVLSIAGDERPEDRSGDSARVHVLRETELAS